MWAARRTLIALSLTIALGALAKHTWFDDGETPPLPTFALDLGRARSMALGGALPQRLNAVVVAKARVRSIVRIAGGSPFTREEVIFPAYQLVYGNGDTVVVDAGPDLRQHRARFRDGLYFEARGAEVQRALERATAIVATSERPGRVGGIVRSDRFERFAPRLSLTPAQLQTLTADTAVALPESRRRMLTPLQYRNYHRLAPGVVLIAAPGVTPGSQVVFVRLADGAEFLLVGDIAEKLDNIRLPRGRARLFSQLEHEDRDAVLHQLRALHALSSRPIHIVVSRDSGQLARLRDAGLIGATFE